MEHRFWKAFGWVPRLPSGVAECGKHKQRKVGGLEAPQSSLEASKSRLEAPKSRPGGSKIEFWGLQNPAQSLPRHHFYTTFKLRRLKMTTGVEVLKPMANLAPIPCASHVPARCRGETKSRSRYQSAGTASLRALCDEMRGVAKATSKEFLKVSQNSV